MGAVLALVVTATAPGLAAAQNAGNDDPEGTAPFAVAVSQSDRVTVSVTQNGTGVANASVVVTTADENASYVGVGRYATGAGGTVSHPAPIEVTATHENRTASTRATLSAADRSFGEAVSAFVSILQNETDGPTGPTLASWVVANNPGNAPAHAGPGGENVTVGGPPAHAGGLGDAGPPADDERGPPAFAGTGGDGDDGNETVAEARSDSGDDPDDGNDTADRGDGPPPHAGPPEQANGG
jgi:hypothetical protein